MYSRQEEGFYTRTEAYNFIKRLLCVKPKILIRRDFFNLFFLEADVCLYKILKSEESIKKLFDTENIVTLYEQYVSCKNNEDKTQSETIYKDIRNKVNQRKLVEVPAA